MRQSNSGRGPQLQFIDLIEKFENIWPDPRILVFLLKTQKKNKNTSWQQESLLDIQRKEQFSIIC